MHIAIDAINFNDHVRGPDRYLISLLQTLAARPDDTRYTIFHAPWQHHYPALSLPPRFRFVLCHPPRRRALRVLWHALVFPRMLRRAKPDVLHLPNLIYVPRIGVPTVLTVHDLAHYQYPHKFGMLRSLLLRRLLHRTIGNADLVIAVSDYTRRDIVRFIGYPAARTRVVWEGGPLLQDQHPAPQPEKDYFLYVGQLERSKNVDTLVRGFLDSELFKQRGIELWIAGRMDNAEVDIRAALDGRNDDGRVKLLGYVADAQLPSLYAGCQAFVFPSLIEGFGLVLLEAMCHGAPVIASDASVMPEVVGEAGLLVAARNAEAVRVAMERVYTENGLRDKLRQAGYARLRMFSWETAAEETWRCYQEVLDMGRAGLLDVAPLVSRTSQ